MHSFHYFRIFFVATACLASSSCGGGGGTGAAGGTSDTVLLTEIEGDRSLAGGETTSSDRTSQAFENPAPNLSAGELERHLQGDIDFGASFVTAPAPVNPGLGPLFNNRSCESCHTKNGRGLPIFGTGGLGSQALVRVSYASGSIDSDPSIPGPVAIADLGTQLQDHAIFGSTPEAQISLSWKFESGKFADGETFELRSPRLEIRLASGLILDPKIERSMRVPQPIIGLGLLEAIPEDAILDLADPGDLDGDGISGKPNLVYDHVSQGLVLGRFGRKANQPTLLQQSASAYANDMGVGNPLFADSVGSIDISMDTLRSAEFYVQTLGVPRAINLSDPQVKQGEKLFLQLQCASCHYPSYQTGEHAVAALSNQRIYPYTDLLLHDMGSGLGDGRTDFDADGNEWRTPPLWGLGATTAILGNSATYLHDGRARNLNEAILWHGGEAQNARDKFKRSSREEREALLAFLRSL